MKREELVGAGLNKDEADTLLKVVEDVVSRITLTNGSTVAAAAAAEVWREIVARKMLQPHHPHALHQLVYNSVYSHWDSSLLGPPLYWFPSLYSLFLPSSFFFCSWRICL